jgi:hypothetical protein
MDLSDGIVYKGRKGSPVESLNSFEVTVDSLTTNFSETDGNADRFVESSTSVEMQPNGGKL